MAMFGKGDTTVQTPVNRGLIRVIVFGVVYLGFGLDSL